MIDDDVVGMDGPHRVGLPPGALPHPSGAGSDANMLNDDIVGEDVDARADERDSRSRCCLTRNGQVRLLDVDLLSMHVDHAAHLEYDDARSLGFQGFKERAGPLWRQRSHTDDLATAPAGRMCRPPHRSWKGEVVARLGARGL